MKSLNRSIIGRTINFIIINICAIVFVASLLGIFIASEFDIYSHSEEEVLNIIVGRDIKSDLLSIVYDNLMNEYTHDIDEDPQNIEYDGYDYKLINNKGEIVAKSEGAVVRRDYILYYDVITEDNHVTSIYELYSKDAKFEGKKYTLIADVNEYVGHEDSTILLKSMMDVLYFFKDWLVVLLASSFIIGLFCLIFLIMAAGRKGKSEEAAPGIMDIIPLDLLIVSVGIKNCVITYMCYVFLDYFATRVSTFVLVTTWFAMAVWLNSMVGLLVTCAARIKMHTLIKNTIIYRIFYFIGSIIGNILLSLPQIWFVVLFVAVILFAKMLILLISGISSTVALYILFSIILDIILTILVLYVAAMLTKLQKMGKDIAKGKIGKKTNTKGLFGAFKNHADNLNSISEGMSLAVEQELKSERMKTELITNVSHDLKTPLTSIINYADLIANEPCENENITEYSDILVKQSNRLRRLIDDLVEVSKATTGNLEVNLEHCNPGVFLDQVGGEYEEKLAAHGLVLMTKQPEEETVIMADPRRMWRIFDNLMNNICKYSLEGSRVYLTLEVIDKNAVITFKNTSKEPLDISEEELMERFVRGDSSRNTEGNGLGLSIARSLTELQNGTMKISIDGDLFKAILSFELV